MSTAKRTIRINYEANTIEITKDFAKRASIRGTDEYKELLKWKNDYRDYKVVVRTASRRTSSESKLTFDKIEAYVKMHDADGEKLKALNALKNEVKGEKLHRTTFFEIKKWFYEQYPELKNVA